MKEIMCTHLAKRGSTYYYRRKTPIELIHLFGKEVMKSLGTKDKKLAESLVRQYGTEYDLLFSAASANLVFETPNSEVTAPIKASVTLPRVLEELTIDEAELYAYRYLKGLRAFREKAIETNNFYNFNAALNNLVGDAKEYLATGKHPFEDNPEPMWKLEAQVKAVKALRKNKDLPYTVTHIQTTPNTSNATSTKDLSLNKLIDKWASERAPRSKSVDKMRMVIHRFEQIVGYIAIDKITKKDTVAFKDGLLEAGSSAANVNHYLVLLNTLLNFASDQAIIESNPAKGVRVKVLESAKTKRQPFDLPALNAIFNSPVYRLGERPVGGKGEAAYWLPLLALFTGARVEELCQLKRDDIYQESYVDTNESSIDVWMFRITDEGEGQTLKNTGSRRRIPIHHKLIELGFIEYVLSISSGSLFPALTPAKGYEKLSSNWSKWFGNYLRKTIKVTDTRMVFHSFRHCFKDFARTASIPSDVHNALTGHSSGDVADNYGSDKYPLRPLVEAMQKYKVTGLVIATNSSSKQ